MIVRLALEADARDERSVTVAVAAQRLGVDHTTVRAMVRKRLLAGFKVGKTEKPGGVRIKLWSIVEWEEGHEIGVDEPAAPMVKSRRHQPRPVRNAADEEAAARLRAWGI